MSSETRLACNRLPFQTDSSCNRGDVDIHVFDDLPICTPIDPTPPEAGMPQVDMQVVPIAPPPCACARVDFKGKISTGKPAIKTGFKAIGDCCDGNYQANIEISIPCVPTVAVEPELVIEQTCGDTITGEFTAPVEEGSCKLKVKPKLKLSVPKIPSLNACETGTLTTTGTLKGTGEVRMNLGRDECGRVNYFCPDIRLDIPCPIELTESKIKAQIGWKKKSTSEEIVVVRKTGDCGITGTGGTLDIGLPCPIELTEVKWGANFGWATGATRKEVTLLSKTGECSLVAIGGDLDLTLPCPINLTEAKVRANITWNGNQTDEVTVVQKDGTTCGIAGTGGTLNLGLPCPVDMEPVVLNIKTAKGGYGTQSVTLLSNNGSCGLVGGTHDITIYTPNDGGGGGGVCPVWVSDVKFDLSLGAGLRIIKVFTDCDGNTWEEDGSTLPIKEVNVVNSSGYKNGSFYNKIKRIATFNIEDENDQLVFTAVEHTCCD